MRQPEAADDSRGRKDPSEGADDPFQVILFYKYAKISSGKVDDLVGEQRRLCEALGLKGRVLVGDQGVNGTLSGPTSKIVRYQKGIELHLGGVLKGIQWKRSASPEGHPFADLQIKQVKEIVSTGGMGVDPAKDPKSSGDHLSPSSFHSMLKGGSADDTVLIDVRNRWEYALGHFKTQNLLAQDPDTKTYAEFKRFVDRNYKDWKGKNVMMYCTGGIRCETASAYLRQKGVERVAQLEGGIHAYLEEFGSEGYFKGKNFVFDQRVALGDPKGGPVEVVGRCSLCQHPYDELDPKFVCTVCRDPVLVCTSCQEKDLYKEWYCKDHSALRGIYFTYLNRFSRPELKRQIDALNTMLTGLLNCGGKQAKQHKNRRRTLRRQIEKIEKRIAVVKKEAETKEAMANNTECREDCSVERHVGSSGAEACGTGSATPSIASSRPPCRTCNRLDCDGRCWGFWAGKSRPWKRRKPTTNSDKNEGNTSTEEEVKR